MTMMKEEMDIVLIEEVEIGHWREAVTEGDPQAPIEGRGAALIMAVVLVHIGKREEALIMAVGAAQVPIGERGLALIMVVHAVVVLTKEIGLGLIVTVVLAVVLTNQKG